MQRGLDPVPPNPRLDVSELAAGMAQQLEVRTGRPVIDIQPELFEERLFPQAESLREQDTGGIKREWTSQVSR